MSIMRKPTIRAYVFLTMALLVPAAGVVLANLAQTPEADIVVVAITPEQQKEQSIMLGQPPSGLRAVGLRTPVYLRGREAGGDTVTVYAWTMLSRPSGSIAALNSITTETVNFTPDVRGKYTVQLDITTAGGTANTTIEITGSNWGGVGTVGNAPPDFSRGQCVICHSNVEAEWSETGHAHQFENLLNALGGLQNYKGSCIQCHSVGYNLDVALNGGWDDIATTLGFTYNATTDLWTPPGNDTTKVATFDSLALYFPDLASVSNVQCENCHGAGVEHKGDVTKIDISYDTYMCGQCHDALTDYPKVQQWEESAHTPDGGTGVYAGWNQASCAACHLAQGFVEHTDNVALTAPYDNPAKITCQACHNPHGSPFEHDLRALNSVTLNDNTTVVADGGSGLFCMNCHVSRRDAETYAVAYHDHFGPHHGPQGDMLAGANAVEFGQMIPTTLHILALENSCVSCHMAATPAAGMPGHNTLGEHSFSVRDDAGTPDNTSDDILSIETCQNCHGSHVNSFDDITAGEDVDGDGTVEGVQSEVKGLMEQLALMLPPQGSTDVTVDTTYTVLQLQAAYNYLFVEEDGSYGVHNAKYAIGLLETTIDRILPPVSVEDGTGPVIPMVYSLEQNAPNPFNPQTTIRYALPKTSHVELIIYDMLGREVRRLVQDTQPAGYHTATWDGRNSRGQTVASGVYIYRVQAGDFVEVKKMTLVK